jgi:hypothetical protein
MPEDIVGIPAESMGLEKDSCFRLNLGCSDDDFEKLMEKFNAISKS